MLKAAVMQPYFFPYIGYFQLIKAVDVFIVYDNIKYTKKGWINRNRFLQNGRAAVFSLPLTKASDALDIRDRVLSLSFERETLLRRLECAYQKTPYFNDVFPLINRIIRNTETNLFEYIFQSLQDLCRAMSITTRLVVSSDIDIDLSLKSEERILALCQKVGASSYINPIGGQELYSKETFHAQGLKLSFLKSKSMSYSQLEREFLPWLSIIDVMMFNSSQTISGFLSDGYDLL
jgi:hypothetical protein